MNEQEMEAINRIYDVTHLINGEHCDYIDIDNICNDEDDLDSCEGFCKAIDIILTLIRKQNNKIQKAIDFINDTNNFFEDGESWQNVLKIKKILEEN